MRAFTAVLAFAVSNAALAAPINLICTGDLVAGGIKTPIANETAILDLQTRTFKPPMYNAFPLLRVGEADISFGSESTDLSTWGNIDRISGSLSMNVLEPKERQKLQAGASAHFLAFMTAKCVPAQKMF